MNELSSLAITAISLTMMTTNAQNAAPDCDHLAIEISTGIIMYSAVGICLTGQGDDSNGGVAMEYSKSECVNGQLQIAQYNNAECTGTPTQTVNADVFLAQVNHTLVCNTGRTCAAVIFRSWDNDPNPNCNTTTPAATDIFSERAELTNVCVPMSSGVYMSASYKLECGGSVSTRKIWINSTECSGTPSVTQNVNMPGINGDCGNGEEKEVALRCVQAGIGSMLVVKIGFIMVSIMLIMCV